MLKQIALEQKQKEIPINENFLAVSPAAIFSQSNQELTKGVTYRNFGGYYFDYFGNRYKFIDDNIKLDNLNFNHVSINNYTLALNKEVSNFKAGDFPMQKFFFNGVDHIVNEDYRILLQKRFGKSIHKEVITTLTASTLINFTHAISYNDLSELDVIVRLKCISAEKGYLVNDEIDIKNALNYSIDSTDFNLYIPANIELHERSTGTLFNIDFTKWSMYINIIRTLHN